MTYRTILKEMSELDLMKLKKTPLKWTGGTYPKEVKYAFINYKANSISKAEAIKIIMKYLNVSNGSATVILNNETS